MNENLTNKETHINKVTDFVNNEVFGSGEHRTGHWKFPYAIGDNNIVGDISISGKDKSKYHNNHEGLVDIALCNEEKKNLEKYY